MIINPDISDNFEGLSFHKKGTGSRLARLHAIMVSRSVFEPGNCIIPILECPVVSLTSYED